MRTSWFFGRRLADELAANDTVMPIGLISSNYENTKIEWWADPNTFATCGLRDRQSFLFNSMIAPFATGPMQIAGWLFYQGEANTFDRQHAFGPSKQGRGGNVAAYDCMFPALIQNWRRVFNQSEAFFGFVQLSTWCFGGPPSSPYDINAIPYLRAAQMSAAALPKVGWATNADQGDGCNIHPPTKQVCANRLADSALALQYGRTQPWRSPSYGSAHATVTASSVSVRVTLKDVSSGGLFVDPRRQYSNWTVCARENAAVNCTAQNQNCMCSTATILLQGNSSAGGSGVECCTSGGPSGCSGAPHCNDWLNATVTVATSERNVLLLTAALPPEAASAPVVVAATQYAFAPIPLMSAYDKTTNLPVLGWLMPLNASTRIKIDEREDDTRSGSLRVRPHARCDVTHGFAAVGDGKHDDTEAIRSALKQCDSVLLPAGKRFLTGPLNLTSNQALVVDGTLLASTIIADYPLVAPLASYGWSIDSNCFPFGVEIVPGALNYQAIINSWNASNVTVSGRKRHDSLQRLLMASGLHSSKDAAISRC